MACSEVAGMSPCVPWTPDHVNKLLLWTLVCHPKYNCSLLLIWQYLCRISFNCATRLLLLKGQSCNSPGNSNPSWPLFSTSWAPWLSVPVNTNPHFPCPLGIWCCMECSQGGPPPGPPQVPLAYTPYPPWGCRRAMCSTGRSHYREEPCLMPVKIFGDDTLLCRAHHCSMEYQRMGLLQIDTILQAVQHTDWNWCHDLIAQTSDTFARQMK